MVREEPTGPEPWWAFTDPLKSYISQPNLTQINQSKPYQIVRILKKVWPDLQILCFSAYLNKPSQNYQVNYGHGWG